MAEIAPSNECSNFLDTFEVLVGTAPDQKCFTVHRDIATGRSAFFRAARSERWTPEAKPIDLPDHNVETFNTYLHCIYRDKLPEYVHPLINAKEALVARGVEYFVASRKHLADCQLERMIDLYVLADSLMDPLTANMAITGIRRICKADGHNPGAKVIDHVFRSTREGDGLRNLVADFYIYKPYVLCDGDFPKAFLLVVVQRFQYAKALGDVSFDEEHIEELDGNSNWIMGEYYQELEQSPE